MRQPEENKDYQDHLLESLLQGEMKISFNQDYQHLEKVISSKIENHKNYIVKENRKKRRLLLSGIVLTACSAILLMIILSYYILYNTSKTLETESLITKVSIGSATIHINKGSSITYNLKRRNVYLEQGEIYVDNPNMEYIEIVTKDALIKIHEGNVNIYKRDNYQRISSKTGEATLQLADSSETLITPGNEFRIQNAKSELRKILKPQHVGSFTRGFVYYENDSIDFVLNDLAAAYRIVITYDKDFPLNFIVSGLFDIKADPIAILSTVLPPSYTVVNINGSYHIKNKENF
jgi:ferric-dicitrate binding protein FerR (iron transport regulator)